MVQTLSCPVTTAGRVISSYIAQWLLHRNQSPTLWAQRNTYRVIVVSSSQSTLTSLRIWRVKFENYCVIFQAVAAPDWANTRLLVDRTAAVLGSCCSCRCQTGTSLVERQLKLQQHTQNVAKKLLFKKDFSCFFIFWNILHKGGEQWAIWSRWVSSDFQPNWPKN